MILSSFLQVFHGVLYARIIDPSWLPIHFPQCIHGHKCTWTHDVSSVRSMPFAFIPYEFCGSMSKVESFLRPEWYFFWVFCDCVSGWEWHNCDESPNFQLRLTLSQVFTCFLSLQHHFLHVPFHFGVCCFLMMLSGKFSEFSWYKLTCNYRCCCSVFSIPVSFLYKFSFL